MDSIVVLLAEWWGWLEAAYWGVDRLWLSAGTVVSILLGIGAARYLDESGFLWKAIVTTIVAAGVFIVFLVFVRMNPVFFDVGDLARSQVSM